MMHFITLPTLAFLASSYFALDVFADSGYGQSCNSIMDYHSGNAPYWTIIANCEEISGAYNVNNFINMDSCFANDGGNLVGRLG